MTDLDLLADTLKDLIVTAFAQAPAVIATIELAYAANFKPDEFTDFRVDIWPLTYRDAGDVTRDEFDLEGMIAIVVAHRYQQPGEVPLEWIQERRKIVYDRVFMVIQDIYPESIEGFRFVDNRVVVATDHQMLREHKVFWSEVHLIVKKLKS